MGLNELQATVRVIRSNEKVLKELKRERNIAYAKYARKQMNEAIPDLIRMIIGIGVMLLGMIAVKEVEAFGGIFIIFLGFVVAFEKDAFTK